MKIGLIIASFEDKEFVHQSIKPWIEYKNKHNNLLISVVNGRFKGFPSQTLHGDDGTADILKDYKLKGGIDFFIQTNQEETEHTARNLALLPLLDNNVDFIIISAFDEVFTLEQIEQIFKYIEKEKFVDIFRLKYKNYTFSDKTYTLGFQPKRIFRVNTNHYKLKQFRWDDDVEYNGKITREDIIIDDILSQKVIPGVLIDHFTWLNNERSRLKTIYQQEHFGPPVGAGCSFKWNNDTNKLEFNDEYFRLTRQSKPEIIQE